MVALDAVRREEAGLHLGVVHGLVFLVAHLHAQGHARIVGQHGFGRGGGHLAGRVGHQVAEHLLPEGGVGLVGVVLPHLPAPAPPGGEDRGAAAAVILRHQQRQGAPARREWIRAARWRRAWDRPLPASWPSCGIFFQRSRLRAGSSSSRQMMLCAPAAVSSWPVKSR